MREREQCPKDYKIMSKDVGKYWGFANHLQMKTERLKVEN